MGEWKWILVYASFLLIVSVFFSLAGVEHFITELPPNVTFVAPATPIVDPFTSLLYVVLNIGVIFQIMLFAPFSTIGILSWIGIVGGIVTTYIILRLVRGGG